MPVAMEIPLLMGFRHYFLIYYIIEVLSSVLVLTSFSDNPNELITQTTFYSKVRMKPIAYRFVLQAPFFIDLYGTYLPGSKASFSS
jgi:hypothetical protein